MSREDDYKALLLLAGKMAEASLRVTGGVNYLTGQIVRGVSVGELSQAIQDLREATNNYDRAIVEDTFK